MSSKGFLYEAKVDASHCEITDNEERYNIVFDGQPHSLNTQVVRFRAIDAEEAVVRLYGTACEYLKLMPEQTFEIKTYRDQPTDIIDDSGMLFHLRK